ncbi:MAG: AraC family transcriptional regulator [Clostridia bacterium]|nr:AraC family transcriptional regulator [Clostridia bacterium]
MDKKIVYINEYIVDRAKNPDNEYFEFCKDSTRLFLIIQQDSCIAEYMHAHNFYEMEFVYSGEGQHILNNSAFKIEKGSAIFRSPNSFHITNQNPENKICSYKLQFSTDWILDELSSYLITNGNNLTAQLCDDDLEEIILLFGELKQEILKKQPYSEIIIKSIFSQILVKLIRHHTPTAQNSMYNPYVSKAIEYINCHFKENLSVKSVAKHLSINPHYLGTLFQQEVGMGMLCYILELKLQLATRLLANSKMPVHEISEECGFNSVSYFIGKFKKRFSVTPSKYRSRI